MASSRFYVGNLFETVTEHELKSLFERFGAISKIELKNKRDVDGNVSGTFAFVTIDGLEEGAPATVIKQCNHLKWKKQILRVQLAQESFMDRLKKEREERQKLSQIIVPTCKDDNAYDPLALVKTQKSEGNVEVVKKGPTNRIINEPNKFRKDPEKPNYDPLALVKSRVQDINNQHIENCIQKRQYYSSSSDEDDDNHRSKNSFSSGKGNLLSKIENFNSDFWNDCEVKATKNQASQVLGYQSVADDHNNKRLSSIRKRRSEVEQQRQSIKSGLSSKIDSNGSTKVKKLCPDSDDEAERETPHHQEGSRSKSTLFDGNESDDDMEERFRVRPQFEGKSGGKLLFLQSKFANDERFKIDERFGEDKKNQKTHEEKDEDPDLSGEKKRNLEILGSVLGKMMIDKTKPSSKLFKDPTKLRYDPNKKEAQALVVKNKVEESSSDEGEGEQIPSKKQNNSIPKDPQTNNKEEKYWVSKSLVDAFSGPQVVAEPSFSFGFQDNQSKSGFSLLSKYGKADVGEKVKPFQPSKKMSSLVSNPFKYDSSDTEDEENPEQKKFFVDPMDLFAQKLKEKASSTRAINESFFIGFGDPRLNEGKNFFSLKISPDELRTQHEEKRPALAQIMKKKLRRRAKKHEKMGFDLRKVNRKGAIKKRKFISKKRKS